jgi:hypothetical protein
MDLTIRFDEILKTDGIVGAGPWTEFTGSTFTARHRSSTTSPLAPIP